MTAPIDLEHLNRYVFGDAALLAEILGIFKEQAASLSERMTPSMDDEAWQLAAHTLKGAARGIGAWALGEAAARAETATPDERAAALASIVDLATRAADYADSLIARAA
ncbi:MAG: Hpt domain-containing protein [Parvularculaceae bacterium]|nr:Hpt domain-containing protein [Parvularculaceae bacterium]